jgi:hypothetical protein
MKVGQTVLAQVFATFAIYLVRVTEICSDGFRGEYAVVDQFIPVDRAMPLAVEELGLRVSRGKPVGMFPWEEVHNLAVR